MFNFVPFAALFACGFALSGALLAWIALERRHVSRHAEREREMIRKTRSRYAAYQDLERHLQRAVTGFEHREEDLLRTLATQKQSLAELLSVLDQHRNPTDEVSADEAVRWMEEVFEPRRERVAERAEMATVLAGWEERLELVQEEKRAEIETHTTLIQELTLRVHDLEPAAAALSAAQEADHSAQLVRLQEELEEALETAGRVALAEASREAAVGEHYALRAQLSVMAHEGERIAELCQERDEAVSALEARTEELVKLRNGSSQPDQSDEDGNPSHIEQELERLRSEASRALDARTERESQFEQELEQTHSELQALRDTLIRTQASSATLAEERDALSVERDTLVQDLELERAAVRTKLEQAQHELQESQQRAHDVHATEAQQMEQATEELESLRADCRAAEQDGTQWSEALAKAQEALEESVATHDEMRGEYAAQAKLLATEEREREELTAQLEQSKQREESARAGSSERMGKASDEVKSLRAACRAAEKDSKSLDNLLGKAEVAREEAEAAQEEQRAEFATQDKQLARAQRELEQLGLKLEKAKQREEGACAGTTARIGKASDEVKSLRAECRAAEKDNKRLDKLLSHAEEERDEAHAAQAEQRAEFTAQGKHLARAQRELEKLGLKLDKDKQREEHARANLGERSARSSEQLKELRTEHRETLAARKRLDSTLLVRGKELAELQSALTNLEGGAKARHKEDSRAITRLEAEVAKGESKLEQVKAAHGERATHSSEELKALRAERRGLETTAKRAATALDDREGELEALEEQVEEAGRVETRLAEERQKSQDRLERELAKSAVRLKKLEERLAKQIETGRAKSKELATRKQDARALQQQVKGLEADLNDIARHLDAKRKAASGQNAQIGDLLQALDRARDEAASTSGKLARKGSQVEAAQNLLSSLLPMLEALGGKLEEADS